jgi:phage tail sheath protein FI
MAEYLSPGVYIEEFESGPRPFAGVSTGIPGFLGFTEKGPTEGPPQLVSTIADFDEIYGGFLSSKDFNNYRFLKYAVIQFFVNGGESCYVMSAGGAEDLTAKKNEAGMVSAFLGKNEGPGKRTGLAAFLDNNVISLICAPGITNTAIQSALIAHCESLKSRFAILDLPRDKKNVDDLQAIKKNINSDYAAIYHPWLQIFDPLEKAPVMIPPSGSVAGVYANRDCTYGVHKAPANEVVKGVTGLEYVYNAAEQDQLNPMGINLIRTFPGQGIRVWGARTCSSNALWKYVNVRRLFIYLDEAIKVNTNWVAFEQNNESLWQKVKGTIDVFLKDVWRCGALMGSSPEEAYYVNIGRSTMTQSDIDNGRLVFEIGAAPVKPGDFVTFRLTQKTLAAGR